MKYVKEYLGESCIAFSFGPQISKELSELVLSLYYSLKMKIDEFPVQVLDIIPSYTSIAIYFDGDRKIAETSVIPLLDGLLFTPNYSWLKLRRIHTIYTRYGGDDFEYIMRIHNLTRSELIKLHSKPEYLIAMLGFKPYFPYLIGLSKKLTTPRLSSPRLKTPVGAVAIGGEQTGIYTSEAPGGWHIIGYTEFRAFDNFNPGDIIKFVEV